MHLLMYENTSDLSHEQALSERDLRVVSFPKLLPFTSMFPIPQDSVKIKNFKNILIFPRRPLSLANPPL